MSIESDANEFERALNERDQLALRLAVIKSLLGLLTSDRSREGRAQYLAYQIATDGLDERAQDAARMVHRADPDYLRVVEDFARDQEGQEVANAVAALGASEEAHSVAP